MNAEYHANHPTNQSYGQIEGGSESSRYSSNPQRVSEKEEKVRRQNESRLMSLVKEESRKYEEYTSGGSIPSNPLNSSSSSLAGSISQYDMIYQQK